MSRIHTLQIGQPQTITDKRGTWHSAIFRTAVTTPVELSLRGLAGDQVADTENHGSVNQAVCCQPLEHYAFWNEFYANELGDRRIGAGGVGENWTVTDWNENDVCIGDVWNVGTAHVQVSAPRYPCTKQDRKLGLRHFQRNVVRTRRTGWYLRVVEPGTVQAGDTITLAERPQPALTVERVNYNIHTDDDDPAFTTSLLDVPELAEGWKDILRYILKNKNKVG